MKKEIYLSQDCEGFGMLAENYLLFEYFFNFISDFYQLAYGFNIYSINIDREFKVKYELAP